MKYFIAVLALAAVALAQQENQAAILRQAQDSSPEGAYSYSFETENGISASESGAPKAVGDEGLAVASQGSFEYTAPDGTPIKLRYVADENGFQPQGDHLPVAHEIPVAIQRAIEYIRAHPIPENQN
ncbi:cuticular protein RR-1 family member 40 precursor [Nasonia vitripennis]|uniref:Uncharacterized protein n=1 Tax=Nasonia vitripennis TaxID=7425 RepID=A0A7M6UG05_NASVI|nr:cuticular protein RR-1 family member 40 precursor [Nasonia vitripennis]